VDWSWLGRGLPGSFHGDFHFENILYEPGTGRFTFLDWRQNFGGLMDVGDIYYDLAKLNHGLIVCHELVARDLFKVEEEAGAVRFELLRKQSLVDCEAVFAEFLEANGYDRKKVQVLTALIYLNIAALHHHPYSLLLYYLGRSLLAAQLPDPSPPAP
jgi:aminoglycoside phosphotransferase (APT) family kinase protein